VPPKNQRSQSSSICISITFSITFQRTNQLSPRCSRRHSSRLSSRGRGRDEWCRPRPSLSPVRLRDECCFFGWRD
jgi:hypothetical protein